MDRRRPTDRPSDPRFDPRHDSRFDQRTDARLDSRNPANTRRQQVTIAPFTPLGPPPSKPDLPAPPKPPRVPEPIAAPGTSHVRLEAERETARRAAEKADRRDAVPPLQPRTARKPHAEPHVAATEILRLVHVDDDLVVVDKAAGFPVAPSPGFRKRSVVQALHELGYPEVYPINLLDAEASGLVVLSRSDTAAQALRWNWRSDLCERTYIAVAQGDIPNTKGRISIAIGAVRRGNSVRHQAVPVEDGGKPACTEWKLQSRGRGLTRVLITLKAGRCHQIRIHFATIGFPILGDRTYGRSRTEVPLAVLIDLPGRVDDTPTLPSGQIALHCARIRMPHPISQAPMDWRATPPRKLTAVMPGNWVIVDPLGK